MAGRRDGKAHERAVLVGLSRDQGQMGAEVSGGGACTRAHLRDKTDEHAINPPKDVEGLLG